MGEFSHFDDSGASRMVDVGHKEVTDRFAIATGIVRMEPSTVAAIRDQDVAKGDVLAVARLAGIMAAKRTSDLIPLCHPLPLSSVEITFEFADRGAIQIQARAGVAARTGVEMEALTAVSVAALTIYDMCKSLDRSMVVERICLEEKAGGQSGHFSRSPAG